jgi:hypothetical protein
MVDIKDFKFNIACDFDNRNMSRHSIGIINAPTNLRTNICTQCLIEIITEGLKRLTDEEKSEILKDYLPESKSLTDEEKAELMKDFLQKEEEFEQTKNAEGGQANDSEEPNSDSLQVPTSGENQTTIPKVDEVETEVQKLDKEAEEHNQQITYRDELIAKAKELGIPGKIATFTNKMLENEIEKKSKLGGK